MRSTLLSILFVALSFSATVASTDSLTIRGPFTNGRLSLYLIESLPTAHQQYLTLEDALQSGAAVIHENNSQSLWIENRSDTDLFIQSGEIIKGGQQDRMIASDMIVAAHDTNHALRVYCVEHDRSFKRGSEPIETFSASHELAPLSHLRIVAQNELTKKVLTPHLGGLTAPDPEQAKLFSSLQTLPEFNRPDDPAQQAIWHDVGIVQSGLTRSLKDTVKKNASPSSLQLSLEHPSLARRRQSIENELSDIPLKDNKAVGVVRAIDGKIVAIDHYASHELFVQLWPKLLKSAATEMLLAGTESTSHEPTADEILNHIDESRHGTTADEHPNDRTLTQVTKTESVFRFTTRDLKYPATDIHIAIITQ